MTTTRTHEATVHPAPPWGGLLDLRGSPLLFCEKALLWVGRGRGHLPEEPGTGSAVGEVLASSSSGRRHRQGAGASPAFWC